MMSRRFIGLLALLVAPAAGLAQLQANDLAQAALEQTHHQVSYDGHYQVIGYPNGDVPANIGVCSDVVIRAYRKLGIDLQQLVHQDMQSHFSAYPSKRLWGLNHTDTNIDHRRVPNLQVFFSRKGQILPISNNLDDYHSGDLVTWILPGNLPHIGIVIDQKALLSKHPLIIHNIGAGPKLENRLFEFPITGHYRYLP